MLTVFLNDDSRIYIFSFTGGAYLLCPVGVSEFPPCVCKDRVQVMVELLEHNIEGVPDLMARLDTLEPLPEAETA